MIDDITFINVITLVGKARFDSRVDELLGASAIKCW